MELIEQYYNLFLDYKIINYTLVTIGTLRLIFKPLTVIATKYVVFTENKKDDIYLNKILESKYYKYTAFILDLTASIKLPTKKSK